MKKFNKKALAGLLVVGCISSSVVVFANTEISSVFRNQFAEWAQKKVEIRIGTAEKEITAKVKEDEAELLKEKEEILSDLEKLMQEQLEAGKDITDLLAAYEQALEDENAQALIDGEQAFEVYFADKTEVLEAFAQGQLDAIKQEITNKKEEILTTITKELQDTTSKSQEQLADTIQKTRREYEGQMSATRKEGQAEVLAYFDAEMKEVYEAIEAEDTAAQAEIIAVTNQLVEEAKEALKDTAEKETK